MTPTEDSQPDRAVLVGIALPHISDSENDESLGELALLAKTLGFEAWQRLTQRRQSLSGRTVVGKDKLEELVAFAANARAVIFNCELSPSQVARLQLATGVEVLDRTGVIVEVFSRHASTPEARLHVEIARLNYLAPRWRSMGIGRRLNRSGESWPELDRRKIRRRVSELRAEIARVQKEQSGPGNRAAEHCAALLGYTNAGKSSWMRALTGSDVCVEEKLFTTLDTTLRLLTPPTMPPILVADTVGLIKNLPLDLVASFRSTLEEARKAGLLLVVVDGSDPAFRSHLELARGVLASIGIETVPWRLIVNKCDRLAQAELEALRAELPEAHLLSAQSVEDAVTLRGIIRDFFEADMDEREVFVSYAQQGAMTALRSQIRVLGERYCDQGSFLRVKADPAELARLLARLGVES